MWSVLGQQSRLIIGQTKVDDKSNEITAIPELLELLDISGCIITIDAIGCQRKIAQQIIEQEGDYVLAVKENQPNRHARIERVLGAADQDKMPLEAEYASTTDKDHGRVEIRHCWVIQDKDSLRYVQKGETRWPSLRSLIKVQSERTVRGQVSGDCRYCISSLQRSPRELLAAIQSHWGIENFLHWCLDMAFREDESRYRTDYGPGNLATVRHISINLLRQDKTSMRGIRARRLHAARSIPYLEKTLGM